jgi:uncharacterized membrane-anchored protein
VIAATGPRRASVLAAWLAASVTLTAGAQDADDRLSQLIADSAVPGPANITLRDEASVDIFEDTIFIPRPAADELMNAMGNTVGPEFIGLVAPTSESQGWFVTIDYVDSGHIADDDARDWDVDELFSSLEQGTREANRWREQQGFPPIEVTGWIEPPAYDSARHQLVWSAGVQDVGAPASEEQGVNYNTYVLGREGYLSLNLVTSESAIGREKAYVRELLDATSFNDGRAYNDFDSNTDRVAAYGLAALVGGVAAKKLGLLAVAAAFLVKGWKLLLIGGVALAAAGRKFLGRKEV